MQIGTHFSNQFTKELVGGCEWRELYHHYRDMSKAAGARKPSESRKAKALWAMKAAKDRRDEFYDSARKEHIWGRKQTRLELWEEHLKDTIIALDKALKCVENQCQGRLLARGFCEIAVLATLRCQKEFRNKKKKKGLCPSRDQQ